MKELIIILKGFAEKVEFLYVQKESNVLHKVGSFAINMKLFKFGDRSRERTLAHISSSRNRSLSHWRGYSKINT